jgi:hypothetical protein
VAGATSGGGLQATRPPQGWQQPPLFLQVFGFFFFLNILILIFLLITVEGILVFKSKLTVKNGIFHPKLKEFLTEGGKVYKNGSLMLSFGRSGSS